MPDIIINNRGNQEVEIAGREIRLTNLGKVFWPEEGFTKGDLIRYYFKISKYIMPYLVSRPESLLRYPNGIKEKSFYQKNIDGSAPVWSETIMIESDKGKDTNYLICNDTATLLFMINLGCIDLNPWNSRIKKIDYPDYLIIDLDPEEIEFKFVIKTALGVKEICDRYSIPAYPKTSGATGIHIWIPVGAEFTYEQVRNFAHILANLVHDHIPNFTSIERSPSKRRGKVYIDYLQNAKGQTLAAPYCIRPRPHMPVSTPLTWEELNIGNILPTDFTVENILQRIDQKGDLYSGVLEKKLNLGEILLQM